MAARADDASLPYADQHAARLQIEMLHVGFAPSLMDRIVNNKGDTHDLVAEFARHGARQVIERILGRRMAVECLRSITTLAMSANPWGAAHDGRGSNGGRHMHMPEASAITATTRSSTTLHDLLCRDARWISFQASRAEDILSELRVGSLSGPRWSSLDEAIELVQEIALLAPILPGTRRKLGRLVEKLRDDAAWINARTECATEILAGLCLEVPPSFEDAHASLEDALEAIDKVYLLTLR